MFSNLNKLLSPLSCGITLDLAILIEFKVKNLQPLPTTWSSQLEDICILSALYDAINGTTFLKKTGFTCNKGKPIPNNISDECLLKMWEHITSLISDINENLLRLKNINNPTDFDLWHEDLRCILVTSFNSHFTTEYFTHGNAQKFINVLLKNIAIFLHINQSGITNKNIISLTSSSTIFGLYYIDLLNLKIFLHPVIDRIVLTNYSVLVNCSPSKTAQKFTHSRDKAWSNLVSNDYCKIINQMRINLPNSMTLFEQEAVIFYAKDKVCLFNQIIK